ncbi:hypothetical protein BBJ28_00025028, partial [Nothophytophthora sp. Chile5]
CNTLVEEALGRFFADCGLPQAFQWGEGSWGKAVGKDAVENSNLGFDKEEEAREKQRKEAEAAAKREEQLRQSAPAYNPVDRSAPRDNSVETVLNELNDKLHIIAAMPYLDEEDDDQRAIKAHFEHGTGLDEIDAMGYTIKAGAIQIWQGERDLNVLIQGVSADSALILQRILLHTMDIDQEISEIISKDGLDKDEGGGDADAQRDSGVLRRVLLGERRPGSGGGSNVIHPVATVDSEAPSRPSTANNGRSHRASDPTRSGAQKYVVKVRVLHGIDLHLPCPKPSCQRAFRPTVSIAVNGGPTQSCMAAHHARNHSIWKPHELLFHVDGNWQQPPTPNAAIASAYVSLQMALSCAVCSCGLEKLDKTLEPIPIGDVGELQLPVKPNEDYQVEQFLPVIRRQRRNSQTALLMAGKVKLRVRVQAVKSAEMQPEIPRRPPLALPANFGEALQLKRKQLKATVAPEQSAGLSGDATSHKQTANLDPAAAAELMNEIALETASDQIEFNQLEVEERVGEGIHSCVSRGRLRLRNGDGGVRAVAVKEFRHQHASPPCSVLRAFRQEYRILDYCRRQNGQQHIVELLGVTLQPPLALVLEYFSRGR